MMCVREHGLGMVAARWQLENAKVDDDQRKNLRGIFYQMDHIW